MMRVRAPRLVGAAFVQRRFTTTSTTTPAVPLAEQGKDNAAFKHDDAATWPKDLTPARIEELLKNHLVAGTTLNYKSLAVLLAMGDHKSINDLTKNVFIPPHCEVNLEEYLEENVDNVSALASMKLQERDGILSKLESALLLQPGSEKRNIAFSYSQRGSGKTQFIKYFVATKRSEAMKCGRVIVRCCDKSANQKQLWLTWTKEDSGQNTATPTTATTEHISTQSSNHSTDDGLCELVRSHVEYVTRTPQDMSKYCDPQAAYKTWISETERYFKIPSSATNVEPLIVLDTCELLANQTHKSLVHKSGKPYTLLEAFCLSVPSPHRVFVTGSDAKIDKADPVLLSMANVMNIGPLPPLSEEGYEKAVAESWGSKINDLVREPIFHWAGGLPRLLRLAHTEDPDKISLAYGSLDGFARCFESYKASATSKYPIDPDWVSHAYTCLLASSTKKKVRVDDVIVLNPSWKDLKNSNVPLTYDQAMKGSIGTFKPDDRVFVVPPITFDDEVVERLSPPILPSQLHPFLDANVCKHFGKDKDVERGRIFEDAFVYAVYARYLLAQWENANKKWIPFANVFEGAIHSNQRSATEDYEVNLSDGVVDLSKKISYYHDAVKESLTYLGGSSHHDAYIWCRKTNTKDEFAVPLQLRHGLQKKKKALKKQLRKLPPTTDNTKPSTPANLTKLSKSVVPDDLVPLLLSVNQRSRKPLKHHEKDIMMIDADAMSSISWLWLVAPEKENKANTKPPVNSS